MTYRWLALAVVAFTLSVGIACGDDSTGPSESPTTTPSQSAQNNDYGPLAVVEGPGGGPQARGGAGPIRFDGSCVTVTVENGDVLLLVWQSANVTWDGQAQAIIFSDVARNTEPITIRDGDTIEVGGASLEDDVPSERELDWLATPHPTCEGEEWFVSGVTKQ